MDTEKKKAHKGLLTEAGIGALLMIFDYFVDRWFLDGIPGAIGILMIVFSLLGFWKLHKKPEEASLQPETAADGTGAAQVHPEAAEGAGGAEEEPGAASIQNEAASVQNETAFVQNEAASDPDGTAAVPETGKEQ